MNRGSTGMQGDPGPQGEASMRPRFMNRGSRHDLGRLDDIAGASMRPRFMNRGSEDSRGRSSSPSTRFNEAPIHESGKSARRRGKR